MAGWWAKFALKFRGVAVNQSDIIYIYIDVMRFEKNSVEPFSRYTEKRIKVKIQIKVALRQTVRKQVSFQDHKKEPYTKTSKQRN